MDAKRKLVIIGSGPAAWSAAIYAARAELKPLVIAGEQPGGQLMLTTKVENYPGFADGVMGQDLMAAMRQQAEKHGVMIIDKNAIKLIKTNNGFEILYGEPLSEHSENSDNQISSENQKLREPEGKNPTLRFSESPTLRASEYSEFSEKGNSVIATNSIIIATGAVANTLKLPGEDRLMGRGVGTCAVCDAPFYRGKDTVFIVGGGDSAIEEASEISKFASKVIILVRKESLRATPILAKRIETIQNVEIWYKSQALELLGDKRLEKVKVNKDGNIAEYPADGLFYAIGHSPATEWLAGSGVMLDEKGYILTPLSGLISKRDPNLPARNASHSEAGGRIHPNVPNSDNSDAYSDYSDRYFFPTSTSVSGVFAAGDCVDFRYRQAIVAAGFGAMAALDCQKWLESQ